MTPNFKPNQAAGKLLAKWWKELQDDHGRRAELKRCDTVNAVIMTPAFQRFFHQLRHDLPECDWQAEQLAAVIGLAARVKRIVEKTDANTKLAASMAARKGDSALVSELRFRRLLQCDRKKLYGSLIRILRLLDDTADLYDLAESVYFWGESVKKAWAYAYFPRVPEKKTA